MSISHGSEGGQAIIAPTYKKLVNKLSLTLAPGVPQTFPRICGPHRIVMTFTPLVGLPSSWTFALTGGSNQTATEVLPMFPRKSDDLYNQVINYRINGNDLPPFGCTITTLPIPPASEMSSRINIFQVDETVTGSNFSFKLAYCPFSGIDPTITSTAAVTIEMKVLYYRVFGDRYRAFGYLESRGAPVYIVKNFPTLFNSMAGVNPLDAFTPLPFKRISGTQTILVANTTTGFYFLFDVDYSVFSQSPGYLGYISPTANALPASSDVENATLVSVGSQNDAGAQIQVIDFILAATDGRSYRFRFDPHGYNQTPPTIQLLAPGPVLGAENLVVNVFVRYFQTI